MSKIIGSTINTEKLWEDFYSPKTQWPKLNENFLKLPSNYSFDLKELSKVFEKIILQNLLAPLVTSKNGNRLLRSYRGFGFTSRQKSKNAYYDAFSLYDENGYYNSSSRYLKEDAEIKNRSPELDLKDRHFIHKNEFFSKELDTILSRFKSPYGKVRLLELLPGGRIAPHVDFPYYDQIRVHAVLYTNNDVWWEVDGEQFQIPADGNFYWFDAGKTHSVWNNGKTPRLVLSVHLSVFRDINNKLLVPVETDLISLMNLGLI